MNYDFYAAWNKEEHKNAFAIWNPMSKSYFKFLFGCFYENKYLINHLKKKSEFKPTRYRLCNRPVIKVSKIKKSFSRLFWCRHF